MIRNLINRHFLWYIMAIRARSRRLCRVSAQAKPIRCWVKVEFLGPRPVLIRKGKAESVIGWRMSLLLWMRRWRVNKCMISIYVQRMGNFHRRRRLAPRIVRKRLLGRWIQYKTNPITRRFGRFRRVRIILGKGPWSATSTPRPGGRHCLHPSSAIHRLPKSILLHIGKSQKMEKISIIESCLRIKNQIENFGIYQPPKTSLAKMSSKAEITISISPKATSTPSQTNIKQPMNNG